MATDEDISQFYDLDNIEDYAKRLKDAGSLNRSDGDFLFNDCLDCKGPLFAHKKCLAKEKTMHWSKEQRLLVVSTIKENLGFQAALSKIDTRATVSTCDICDKRFENRNILENHMRLIHK